MLACRLYRADYLAPMESSAWDTFTRNKYAGKENQLFDMLENWHYDYTDLGGWLYVAKVLNEKRFDIWVRQVLKEGTNKYSENILSELLVSFSLGAPIFLYEYPEIFQYETSPSANIRCAFSDFATGLDKQTSLSILNTMKNAEKDEKAKKCIMESIQWRMKYND